MRKKTIAILLALAMMLGTATIAFAADPTTKTDGSIAFKSEGLIILPPQPPLPFDPEYPEKDCCDCFGKDAEEGCKCPCHLYDEYADPEDPKFPDGTDFNRFKLGGNLYFGEWTIGDFGIYDSKVYGKPRNTHTGILTVNQTTSDAKIAVSITEFKNNGDTVLEGAELKLMALELAAGAGFVNNEGIVSSDIRQLGDFVLDKIDRLILTIPAGSRVKASWYGLLSVMPGTTNFVGTAQATLTWSDMSSTP